MIVERFKFTIEIILKKVYDEQLIETKITRKNLEKLLLMCTQGTPFTFNNKMYMQTDGVMMGSPLGALFANTFMCELKKQYYSITWRQSLPMETLCRRYICLYQTRHRTRNPTCSEFISREHSRMSSNKATRYHSLMCSLLEKMTGRWKCVYRKPTHTYV